jgi:poly(A) polymerase
MTRLYANWISNPATQAVCKALTSSGNTALFVGGCVRNTILGVPVSDIDIATDATPQVVLELAREAGIKAIATGIEHGTVTLIVDGLAHEVTTFRRDIATDGRHAVIAFSDRVEEDAARRDFTMNALYARPDGTVLDPLNGLPDLVARKVRFIGSATDRIEEDYLRSLRYFRFHAWYGDQDAGFDPDALAAIADHLDGLDQLSRERIGAEFLKLLAAPDPAPSVATMQGIGVLRQILPDAECRALAPLIHVEHQAGLAPEPVRRLAALGCVGFAEALRLSNAKSNRLKTLRTAATGVQGASELGYRLNFDLALDALVLRCALLEQPWQPALVSDVATGAEARFPISARDLMPQFEGADLGRKLAELETQWIESGFTLSRSVLLSGSR